MVTLQTTIFAHALQESRSRDGVAIHESCYLTQQYHGGFLKISMSIALLNPFIIVYFANNLQTYTLVKR